MVPLAAYARAVATGALDPQERIAVTDWERWYLPGTDGGAHDTARTRLPGDTVTLDQMVSAMIRESDNAAPDYPRDRLGDQALIEAAAAGSWTGYSPSTKLGDAIRLLDPAVTDPWAAARRHAADPGYRTEIQSKTLPALGYSAGVGRQHADGFGAPAHRPAPRDRHGQFRRGRGYRSRPAGMAGSAGGVRGDGVLTEPDTLHRLRCAV
ncbi:serine hydrolase [Nocardia sp. bgisy134]|uniref:serine hydrolase n=1 Tax=Nocardia sp. bgisy134 TaxID=3413789 RepID=UPI003D7294B5